MSSVLDSSESSSPSTESTQQITDLVTENSSNRQSETTSSTPQTRLPQLFKPGQSGNPLGRPKGSKNRITVLKQTAEVELREYASPFMVDVIKKALDMALKGDRLMIKLLLELHISKHVIKEDESGGKSQVAVIIQNLTDPAPKPVIKVIEHNE